MCNDHVTTTRIPFDKVRATAKTRHLYKKYAYMIIYYMHS